MNARPPSPWTEADALMTAVFALLCAAGGIAAGLAGRSPSTPQPIMWAHVLAMLVTPAFAAALASHRLLDGRVAAPAPRPPADPLRDAIRGFCIGLALLPATLALAWLTCALIEALGGQPPQTQPIIESLLLPQTRRAAAIAAGLVSVLLTPAAEELLHRDVLLGALRVHRGDAAAVALSSLFFGLLHLHLPVTPALVFLGAVLAVVRIRTGSLLACIAAHATFNAANLALALLA